MKLQLIAAAVTVLCLPLAATAADYGNYKGRGGMLARSIPANVYAYHYDNGFTGVDAMGWDPNLQFAWSRIAAADACGVGIDKAKAMAALQAAYDQDPTVQEIIGIGFHAAQINANPAFCDPARVAALGPLVPHIEDGSFERPFK